MPDPIPAGRTEPLGRPAPVDLRQWAATAWIVAAGVAVLVFLAASSAMAVVTVCRAVW